MSYRSTKNCCVIGGRTRLGTDGQPFYSCSQLEGERWNRSTPAERRREFPEMFGMSPLSGVSGLGISIVDPLSGILGALATGASAVPGIAALFGETKAQKDQKRVAEETLKEQQAVAAMTSQSFVDAITAAAPYAAATALGLALIYAVSRWSH